MATRTLAGPRNAHALLQAINGSYTRRRGRVGRVAAPLQCWPGTSDTGGVRAPTLKPPRLILRALPPDLPPALRALQTPCYLHRPPAWKQQTLVAAALVPILVGLVWVARQAMAGRAGTADWAMGAFLLAFVAAVLRPSAWRPHVSLAADVRGLYFLGTDPAAEPVFVPWTEVGELSIGLESAGHDGRARSVVVRIDDGSAFWAPAKASRFMRNLVGTPDAQGRRGVPLGNAGLRAEDTLEALRAIRQRAA